MKYLRPLLSRHPEWFTGMKLIYDAEAIFALREVREERLEGKAISEREIDERVRRELSLCAGFERILTVSKEEALQFAKHGLDTYLVGDAVTISPCEAAWATRQDILFVGPIHADVTPNALAVFWFLDQVWPEFHRRLPWARFVIVGLNSSPRLNSQPLPERVVVTGAVDDITPFYNSARVFVAPTRAAAGIPLKVIEAAGRGVPVVATPLLVSQLRWNSPAEILAADGGSQFADACVKLCTDERIWQLQREALARVTPSTRPPYSPSNYDVLLVYKAPEKAFEPR